MAYQIPIMQNKKNTWLDKIKDVLGDSPKAKEDLVELKNSALEGIIDIESLKMIEGVLRFQRYKLRDYDSQIPYRCS